MSEISAQVVSTEGGENAPQNDPLSNFSFSSNAHSKAMEMLGDDATPAPQEQSVNQTPSIPQQQQEPAQVIAEATPKQIAQLKDDDLVEIQVDGEAQTMPWKEAKGYTMRQAKFTKEMQLLRKEQQDFESGRQSLTQARDEREALVGLLKNENLLKQFLQKQYPHLIQQAQAQQPSNQPQVKLDDVASIGQVDQIARAYAENVAGLVNELKGALQQELQNVTTHIEDRQATAKLSGEINTTIQGMFAEHPYMNKVVPNAEQLLRYEVLQLQPSTPEETIEAFKQVFNGWVENFKSTVAETNKSQVIQKQKLVNNNIQPPGGAQVQPQPTDFRDKNGKVDWNKLRAAALDSWNG